MTLKKELTNQKAKEIVNTALELNGYIGEDLKDLLYENGRTWYVTDVNGRVLEQYLTYDEAVTYRKMMWAFGADGIFDESEEW